jgi:DNA helicase HerA-like ATPase
LETSTAPISPHPVQDPLDDPRDHANFLIGRTLVDNSDVRWTLDEDTKPKLPNFGLLVSGDAGQGKTQIIKAVIAEAAALGCPILIFDFKNDYGGAFASAHSFELVDLNERLPFNPLKLPPHAPSGAQAINHIFEVAGLLGETLHLGDQQKALLRNALEAAYTARGVPLNDWVSPDETPAPSLGDVIEKARALDEQSANRLINRLGLLHGKRLLPADAEARMSFGQLVGAKVVLSFSNLPNDDQLKRALAELILIQIQGHMLRGAQPRALRRLLVFDEAWRAADSKRLIQLAREGRAFGVGVVAGSQFADDLSAELTGNLATKLHFYNSDAGQRRKLVQAILGTSSGSDATVLTAILGNLKQFQAVFTNQQYVPYTAVIITPYFERRPL